MSPQREAAVGYLRTQLAKYRADLAVWRSKARRTGEGLAQSMIVSPLQELIEDCASLLDRLRCRQGASHEADGVEHADTGSANADATGQA